MIRQRKYYKLLVAFGIIVSCWVALSGSAKADYNSLPSVLVGSSDQYVNISDGYNTDANGRGAYIPETMLKLYTQNRVPGGVHTVTIYVHNLTADNDCGDYTILKKVFKVYADSGNPHVFPETGPDAVSVKRPACVNAPPYYDIMTISIPDEWYTLSTKPDQKGISSVDLQLLIASDNPNDPHTAYMSINAPPGDRIGYTNFGGSYGAAIFPRYSSNPIPVYPEVRWNFRPSCNVINNANLLYYWETDFPSSNQPSGSVFGVNLHAYDQYTGTQISNTALPRDNGTHSYAPIGGWNPDYKYSLVFSNVLGGNGIPVQLPFDSGDFNFECPKYFNTSATQGAVTLADSATDLTHQPEDPAYIKAEQATISRASDSKTAAPIISATYSLWHENAAGAKIGAALDTTSSLSGPWADTSTPVTLRALNYSAPGGVRDMGWNVGDKVCTELTYTYKSGYIIPGDPSTVTSSTVYGPVKGGCTTISNRPFVKVYGGSVSAGGSFSTAANPTCTGGGILASWNNWNNDTGQNPNQQSFGAGTALAAIASGKITGFSSAQTAIERSPTDLSFANNVAGTPNNYSPTIGGNYGATHCLSDADVPQIASLKAKSHNLAANSTIHTKTITGGSDSESDFVAGDVYIDGNITYASNWDPNDAPSFVLKATGNIYISNNVTRLDGMYVAVPDSSGNGGKIYTCATGVRAQVVTNQYSNCRNQLVVRGSFVANQVNLQRTLGTLHDEKPTQHPGAPTAAVKGVRQPLVWTEAGKQPGTPHGTNPAGTCTQITEGREPSNHYWYDNWLCVTTTDTTSSSDQIKLAWSQNQDSTTTKLWNSGTDLASAGGVPSWMHSGNPADPLNYCTASWGSVIGASPYNYPSGPSDYWWTDDYLCANVPISFQVSTTNLVNFPPIGMLCTKVTETSDIVGNNVWQYTYVCIQQHKDAGFNPGTPATPANRNPGFSCENSTVLSWIDHSTCAAEVFYSDPTLYFSNPAINAPSNGALHYDSITSLPPVL